MTAKPAAWAYRPGDLIVNALRGVEADLYTRAVDVLVSRLRQKLRPTDYIKTVRGAGYSFVAPRR